MLKNVLAFITILLLLPAGAGAFEGENDQPFHGFLEYDLAGRVVSNDIEEDDYFLNETRLQIEFSPATDNAEVHVKVDFIADGLNQERGGSDFELREGYILILPADYLEIKVGRQILTWGTGDYLFINDVFPKDWYSFFSGRNDEYLKAPSDSIRLSFFPEAADVELVLSPFFDQDIYLTGERFSIYDPFGGGRVGSKAPLAAEIPEKKPKNGDAALRISRNISGIELALYAYRGFYRRPLGMDTALKKAIFPRLSVYGASARGVLLGGVGNIELGYYDSLDNRHGDNPFIENGDIKTLVGYSRELFADFTASMQYYTEYQQNYDSYKNAFPGDPNTAKDRLRHLFSLRLTKLADMQRLRYSLFAFYSPSDQDVYFRPSINYNWTDQVTFAFGANLFAGKKEHTFFSQLKENTNIYGRIRYGF